ncbi:MAG: hypothetical protein ACIAXF_00345 [Phycisphaerales bacterium JB063]
MTKKPLPYFAAPLCTALLLVGVFGYSLTLPTPEDAEAYHARVMTASEQMPQTFAGWTAEELPMEAGAMELLKPNVALRLRLTHPDYAVPIEFLIVQCRDARDLAGHYPPKCYPQVNGYVMLDAQPRNWHAGGAEVPGMEYRFAIDDQPGASERYVMHFMMLPDGRIVRSIDAIYEAGADYLRRHHGAAQCQLFIRDASLSQEARDRAFNEILTAYADLIHAIGSAGEDPTP